jgi:hypothetical protein
LPRARDGSDRSNIVHAPSIEPEQVTVP